MCMHTTFPSTHSVRQKARSVGKDQSKMEEGISECKHKEKKGKDLRKMMESFDLVRDL